MKFKVELKFVAYVQGGPLLWETNGKLIGVTSFAIHLTPTLIDTQVFTNVPYYYEWITRRSGLKLPNCVGPQADSFAESIWPSGRFLVFYESKIIATAMGYNVEMYFHSKLNV